MADRLFERAASVNVGGVLIDGLDFVARITRSLKPEPNTCDLVIYGLSEDTRSRLASLPGVPVQVDAGYKGATSTIFLGTLRSMVVSYDGPEVITTLSSGDGEKAYQTARVVASVKREAKAAEVLELVATSLGVGRGNLDSALSTLRASGVADRFAEGAVFAGRASDELTQVCRSLGLTWSIQSGALQILPITQALAGEAILLSPQTGLVGSPSVDGEGTLTARMLAARNVDPGRLVVLESRQIKGAFRIEKTSHTLDTAGSDWYVDLEGRRY